MDQKLKNYSSGMQVRLAFSMATRANADILLIDEVLAVGDADFQRKCFDYFRLLKRKNKTVVFVSHDMNAVREYCDRAVMIEKSRVVTAGDTEKVALEYTKLFTEKERSRGANGEISKRWGDGTIKYSSVAVQPQVVREEKTIKIVAKAKAYKVIENPVFGFVIKNTAGQHIIGTNSKIKHYSLDKVKAGEDLTIEWEVPHVFGDGTYSIDVAVQRTDGTRECDWWEDATTFTVFKEERTPYIITPEVNLVIKST
jgi:ABC-type glutathione transport system ATPase component